MRDTIERIVNHHSSNADGDGRRTVERSIRACVDAVVAPARVLTLSRIQLDAARSLSSAYRSVAACNRALVKATTTGSSTLVREAEDELDAAIDAKAQAEATFLLYCGSLTVEVQR